MAKTIQAKKSSDRIHKTEVRVIYADTDHGGVAYYASYLRWFEVGRTELLRSVGLTYSEIEKSGILCPVVEVQCRYIQPARYDDILLIKTRIEKLGRSHIIFGYEIEKKSDSTVLAVGQTTNAFVNQDLKCTRPPREVMDSLARFIEKSNQPHS